MDPRTVKGLEGRLNSRTWLIGRWVRRRAARSLADAAHRGDGGASRALATAMIHSVDGRVRQLASEALRMLTAQSAIDRVCEIWAETRDPGLYDLIKDRGWIATAPAKARILTALKLGRAGELTSDGPDIVDSLLDAIGDTDPEIAHRVPTTLAGLSAPGVAAALARSAQQPKSEQAVELAFRVLEAVRDQGQIDEVCAVWAEKRHPRLARLLSVKRWVATDPVDVRVLSALHVRDSKTITSAGAEIVEPLVRACIDADAALGQQARVLLGQLKSQDARDAVCRLVLNSDHTIAREAAIRGGYVPKEEHDRALFFFLTEQWERYQDLDFDYSLLRAVYRSAQKPLKQRIFDLVRASGRTDFLNVAVGSDYRARAASMANSDAEFVIQVLTANREWGHLWPLAFEFSFALSVAIIRTLAANAWKPEAPDDRATFEELASLASTDLHAAADTVRTALPPAVRRAVADVHGSVNAVAFAPVRPVIALGTGQRRVAIWNFQSALRERTFNAFDHSIGQVTFTRDGDLLCGERTNVPGLCSVYGWVDGARFRLVRSPESITALEPVNGSTILVADKNGQVELWDVRARTRIRNLALHSWAREARVSPDGRRAVLLHDGLTIVSLPELHKVGSAESWTWRGVARAAAFAPVGDGIIVGKFNGEVLVCQSRSSGVFSIERDPLARHDSRIQGVEVLPARGVVITAGAEGRIQFTSWTNRAVVGNVDLPGSRITSLHVAPDGAFMAVGHSDSMMSLWDLRVMDIPLLFARPFGEALPLHLAAVEAALGVPTLKLQGQEALRYVKGVLRRRFRYAIEIDDVSTIRQGRFDIEID